MELDKLPFLLIFSLIWNKLFKVSSNIDAESQSWLKGKGKLNENISNPVLHRVCFAYLIFHKCWPIIFNISSKFGENPCDCFWRMWSQTEILFYLFGLKNQTNVFEDLRCMLLWIHRVTGVENSIHSELPLWGGDIWAKKWRIKKTKRKHLEQRKWLVQSLEGRSELVIWVHWKISFP